MGAVRELPPVGELPQTGDTRRPSNSSLVFYAIALCAVGLGYSLITEHIWEDALITLRPAENFVNGRGLTFNDGTRVHTFTSPINVLMLVASYVLSGKGSYEASLWVYRLFSIAAFAGSGVLLLKSLGRAAPYWSVALGWLAITYMFDAKSVVFTCNGMETGYWLLCLAWAVYLLSRPDPGQWLARGFCWGALMWTRPDSCVYIVALALAELLFSGTPRKIAFVSLLKSGLVCGVVYSPWLIWATWYYGSPIPNTIIAKSNPGGAVSQLMEMLGRFPKSYVARAGYAFHHIYPRLGPLADNQFIKLAIDSLTAGLGLFCAAYWLFPSRDRLGRMASFCFAASCFYLSYQSYTYPWYVPPATLFGLVTLSRAATMLVNSNAWPARKALAKLFAIGALVCLAIGQIVLFGLTTYEMKIQQTEIETGTRKEIGLWLHDHGKPTDTVYLECLGYIGYFSGMTMNDYPGLASPTVVKLRKEKSLRTLASVIPELLPDWVILRAVEYQDLNDQPEVAKSFHERYQLVRKFSASERLADYSFIPGKGYLVFDSQFLVFHRKPGTS